MSPFIFGFIPSYGFLVASAFVVGIAVVGMRNARRIRVSFEHQLDLAFWIVFGALVGSRVLFMIVNWRVYLNAPPVPLSVLGHAFSVPAALAFWQGGLVFYGGLIGATIAGLIVVRRAKLPALALADGIAPALAAAHAVGRLGCFFAGCCYGKPGEGGFGVAFPPGSLAYSELLGRGGPGSLPATAPLHPTQLYDGFGELLIFGLLVWLMPRKRYHGQIALVWIALYPVLRFADEVFRGDALRGFVFRLPIPSVSRLLHLPGADPVLLSTSQLAGILIAAVSATTLIVASRRRRGEAT